MICIICEKEHFDETVEHIVPRSMGNIHYILPKGHVCSTCNNRFARFENTVLNLKEIYEERSNRNLIKSERQVSKKNKEEALVLFVIKLAYESIYFSRRDLLTPQQYDELRQILLLKKSHIYKILTDKILLHGKPIPSFINRFRLERNGIKLRYRISGEQIWMYFGYGSLNYVLRLF